MIEIKGLYKRYHNHHGSDWVLRDINLTLPKGVSVGLLGRNGAGKSTLLKLIADMDTPERGEIIRHSRVSWPIGLAGGFQGSMTGRQNVKFVARVHGGGYDVHDVIDKVEDFAELGDAFDEPIRTYSSGMKARLNFGMSLAFDFDVYLSDEATSVGDRAFKAKASKAFKDKVGQASLIMVSHSEGILKELCQAGVYLKDGQATWYDDINDAIKAYHEETNPTAKAKGTSDKAMPAPAGAGKPTASLTFVQANQRRIKARARLDAAKLRWEQGKADGLPEPQLAELQQAFKRARNQLHKAKQTVQELQNGEG
ncbi:ABC transporter ATP-binding protein [Halomonas urumqiensis]|uniref:ABC transporter ATP-binding protein n=1 Tax=Halomonas urumqiensis TaxID=1684789 RepID=A0A2N7UCE5_9GAMM|nr:ABC transporter ATP-binding protein [Halomonas urumqiensis]PMR78118.1 ABC transporter ATP-binding protein [Halomonas urumqiensis]PTB03269.1 ABC transporter ATP-binding protein [Halomonas urumqiensis]GHE20572.1 hypothetical protein GCM10017767_10930 [Halomonas urumqiensis]